MTPWEFHDFENEKWQPQSSLATVILFSSPILEFQLPWNVSSPTGNIRVGVTKVENDISDKEIQPYHVKESSLNNHLVFEASEKCYDQKSKH